MGIPLSSRFFPRRIRPEITTPNEPTFNATLLIIGILLIGVIGVIVIQSLGFPPELGR